MLITKDKGRLLVSIKGETFPFNELKNKDYIWADALGVHYHRYKDWIIYKRPRTHEWLEYAAENPVKHTSDHSRNLRILFNYIRQSEGL